MSESVALVTGGARRIGRAIVGALAEAGFAVAIHYRHSRSEAEELAEAVREKGARAVVLDADLADAEAVGTLVPRAVSALGPVTLLVNNASIFEPDDVADLGLELWEKTFAINLRTPAMLARDVAAALPEGHRGAIVNILDQRVLRPNPHFFSYTLTKSALATATRTMAQALAPRIRVNAVAPGPIIVGPRQSAEDFARQSAATLLGHGPSPADVAAAVLYLATATGVTGQILAVDAGQNLQWRTVDVDGISE